MVLTYITAFVESTGNNTSISILYKQLLCSLWCDKKLFSVHKSYEYIWQQKQLKYEFMYKSYIFLNRMQEMKANNLFGDDSPTTATPCITEISLRDLCTQIDFDALKSQNTDFEIPEEGEEEEGEIEKELSDIDSDDKEDSDIDKQCSFYLPENVNSPSSNRSSFTSRKRVSDASSAKRTSVTSSIRSKRTSSLCQENVPEIQINSDNIINEYSEMFPKNRKEESLPNGNLHFANNYTITDCRPLYDDTNEEEMSLLKHNLHKSPSMPSKSRYQYTNRKKRKSWQETSVDDSDITYDDITKDDLLLMWKASEMELNDRLQKALREKSRLQRLLVDLDTSQEPTSV